MQTRDLGPLAVGAIGLGCMPMSWAYSVNDADDQEIRATLHRAVESGVSLFDTADVYGPYTNEELLGRFLVADGLRNEVVLATKVGLTHIDSTTYGRDASPEHIRAACDASLRRLRTDVIDLYQLHRVDPHVPLAETWGAMSELVANGKVRFLGMSEASVSEINEANELHPVASVQSELSIWTHDAMENGVLKHCEQHGIGFLAYSPLGRGYLTGKLSETAIATSDFRSSNPRFTPEAMKANEAIVAGIQKIAERHSVTSAQVSLAWVLAQGEHVVPIPGTKRRRWLDENVAAADLQLDEEDFRLIAQLPTSVAPRY